MSFEPRKTEICEQVAAMDDRELLELFIEIYDYNETGVLHGDKLRNLSMQRFKAYDMVRVYEDKILFEMARRYANMLSSGGQDAKEDHRQAIAALRNASTEESGNVPRATPCNGRYIDRVALGVGPCNPDVFEDPEYARGWNALFKIISEAPAADLQQVVRRGAVNANTR